MEENRLEEIRKEIYDEIGMPRYKDKIQQVQSLALAPYATVSPRENSRRCAEERNRNIETRSGFQRDRDRIIHSCAFRRLMYKTQVFVNHEGDYYRTRMTHSLEVAQIARGIARSLGVNEDLTEAIALGHDLGHTPFGHAVEELLSDFLRDERGFLHNEQSVRIVDILEDKDGIEKGYGLNLTWEVREGILKHTSDRTEGIHEDLRPEEPSSLEGQIVALADTLAYVCHDLDDGIRAGLIDEKMKYDLIPKDELDKIYARFDRERDQGISSIINALVYDLVETSWKIILDNNIDSLEKVRAFEDVRVEGNKIIRLGRYEKPFKSLKKFVGEHIYQSPMTTIMDEKAKRFMDSIYKTYRSNPKQLPSEIYKKFMNASGSAGPDMEAKAHYGYKTTPSRVLCDYLASMTDRSALETYEKLFAPFTKI